MLREHAKRLREAAWADQEPYYNWEWITRYLIDVSRLLHHVALQTPENLVDWVDHVVQLLSSAVTAGSLLSDTDHQLDNPEFRAAWTLWGKKRGGYPMPEPVADAQKQLKGALPVINQTLSLLPTKDVKKLVLEFYKVLSIVADGIEALKLSISMDFAKDIRRLLLAWKNANT